MEIVGHDGEWDGRARRRWRSAKGCRLVKLSEGEGLSRLRLVLESKFQAFRTNGTL